MANDKRFTAVEGRYFVGNTEIGTVRNITYNETINVITNKALGDFYAHSVDAVGGSVTVSVEHFMVAPDLHAMTEFTATGTTLADGTTADIKNTPIRPDFTSKEAYANWLLFGNAEISIHIKRKDIAVGTDLTQSIFENSKITADSFVIIKNLRMTSRSIRFTQDDYVTGSADFIGTTPALAV